MLLSTASRRIPILSRFQDEVADQQGVIGTPNFFAYDKDIYTSMYALTFFLVRVLSYPIFFSTTFFVGLRNVREVVGTVLNLSNQTRKHLDIVLTLRVKTSIHSVNGHSISLFLMFAKVVQPTQVWPFNQAWVSACSGTYIESFSTQQ